MHTVTLGKTGITVNKNGFGALPIQRISTAEEFWKDLETSLHNLRTDYIDIYQFHNPACCPKPGDGSGLYEAMQEAKAQGKIRHAGITNHRLAVAHEAVDSGLYETLQFPFCYLSGEQELSLVRKCKEAEHGIYCHEGPFRRSDYKFCGGLCV